jgi:hypothetical protein
MTRRKGSEPTNPEVQPDILDQLFASGDSGLDFDWGGLDWGAFAAIAEAVTGMGGMVTLYRKHGSGSIVCSVRLADKRGAWEFDNSDQWNAILPSIGDRYRLAYGRWLERNKRSEGEHKST